MIVVQCSSCNAKFKAQESIIGSVVECPMCQDQFVAEDLNSLPELTVKKPVLEPIVETSPAASIKQPPSVAATPSPQQSQASTPVQSASQPTAPSPVATHKEIEDRTVSDKKVKPQGFAKTFSDVSTGTPSQNVNYSYTDYEKSLIPPPAWKQALDILSWVGVAIGALILVIGSLKGGFLTDAGHDKRFLIAGFISLVGSIGFILSATKRLNAIILSILATITLFTLAFYLPIYETPTKDGISDIVTYSIGPLKNEVRK